MDWRIEQAAHEDCAAMAAALAACGLSSSDILAPGTMYWVCRAPSGLAGLCGIELGDGCALLRSVCVIGNQRGRGIAAALIECAMRAAARLDAHEVYLFSKDTGGYFERLGWREVSVEQAAARLSRAPQVSRYEQIGWYPDERAFVREVSASQ
jgi:N-acetylglutamate synthase-like GNAT family acetyltransferase